MKALTKNYSTKLVALLVAFAFIVVISLVGCAQEPAEEPEANVDAVEQVEEAAEPVAEDATEEAAEAPEAASEPATTSTETKSQPAQKNTSGSTTQSAPKSTPAPSQSAPTATKSEPAAPAHTHNWVPVTSSKTMYVCCDGASFASDAGACDHEYALMMADEKNHSRGHVSQKTTQTTTGYKCSCGATK